MHLLGTSHANRKGNPKDLTAKKLKVGEVMVVQNPCGIVL